MTGSHTVGGRIAAGLGVAAAIAAIGTVGHCIGVEKSSERIERLESDLTSLRSTTSAGRAAGTDLSASTGEDTPPRTASGSSGSATEPAGAPRSIASAQTTAEARGFRFELQYCSRRGGEVRCRLLVTSLDEDAELSLANAGARYVRRSAPVIYSRLIDDGGLEYFSSEESSLGSASGPVASTRLAAGVPMNLSLHFPGVPPTATNVRLLELVFTQPTSSSNRGARAQGFRSSTSGELTVVLRNIPIEQG